MYNMYPFSMFILHSITHGRLACILVYLFTQGTQNVYWWTAPRLDSDLRATVIFKQTKKQFKYSIFVYGHCMQCNVIEMSKLDAKKNICFDINKKICGGKSATIYTLMRFISHCVAKSSA